ncbi:type II toxin-antitoxin system VapC family toxin [Variovorax paradoxus]|nr:type II toxin-antitoxin system VapC family toxin [Variovorax paradoxus]
MYVLDTNVISELRSGKAQQSKAVREWAAAQPGNELYLSAITVMEMQIGAQLMERRDAAQGRILRSWNEKVFAEFEGRVLSFSEQTAMFCAPLHVPHKKSFRDSMIAAAALEHRFTVVTRNVGDFKMAGLKVANPWEHTA